MNPRYQLVERETLTDAKCINGFSWANNIKGVGPCLIAAQVMGSCNEGNWKVPLLSSSDAHYFPPNETTANLCSCSWAAYNLLSACTACQGFESSMYSWDEYKSECPPKYLSNTYFPLSIKFLGTPFIPYWSGINPLEWTDMHFNLSQARVMVSQNYANLVSTSKWQGSMPKPIPRPSIVMGNVGSILGGLSGIMLVVDVVIYMKYRERRAEERGTDTNNNIITRRRGQKRTRSYVDFLPTNNVMQDESTLPAPTLKADSITNPPTHYLPRSISREVMCPPPARPCDSLNPGPIIAVPRSGIPAFSDLRK
ncbi:hypothetical protein BDZ94DRAFT_1259700 [Collybia nuda]|uniref:Uncharacterized protein n=1 Tax=Collybia nuda TaxID=64659 RepID=A0A9P5Y6J4_9AGAR|nr:hypothetical protein BDZ94DRAFT_1259700 [Collybia nuda]